MRWPRPSLPVVLRVLLAALAAATTAYAAFYTTLPTPTPPEQLLGVAAVVLTVALTAGAVTGDPTTARVASGTALLYVAAHIVSLAATSPLGVELTAAAVATNIGELVVAALAWLLATAAEAGEQRAT